MKNADEYLHAGYDQLAEHLHAQKAALIDEWARKVRADSDVPSGPLAQPELIDHVPKIIDTIIQALRQYTSDTTMAQAKEVAARHTVLRWVQGYSLHAVLREISLLRSELIQSLRTFENEHQSFPNNARLFASTTVHSILDNIVMDASDTFFRLATRTSGDEA